MYLIEPQHHCIGLAPNAKKHFMSHAAVIWVVAQRSHNDCFMLAKSVLSVDSLLPEWKRNFSTYKVFFNKAIYFTDSESTVSWYEGIMGSLIANTPHRYTCNSTLFLLQIAYRFQIKLPFLTLIIPLVLSGTISRGPILEVCKRVMTWITRCRNQSSTCAMEWSLN